VQSQKGPLFLGRMRALSGSLPANPARRIRPSVAIDMTRLFMGEYAHGAPLEPSALLGFWERCGLAPAGVTACQRGLRTAQRLMIGDLPPDPDEWLSQEIETASEPHAAPEDKPEEHGGGGEAGGDDAGQ
jgi:hypothetical protein